MEHDKLLCCAFQALKVGPGSEDAGSERKGTKQDHAEQPWVWLCGHRQDMDEPFVEFLDVFLSLTHIVLFLVFLFFLIF